MSTSPSYTLRNKRVWVAGDRGLVGSALVRRLDREGCELLTAPREAVDLRRPEQVERWMADARPQAVFLAAARVGGIYANDTRPAEFIYDNLMIQSNVVEASRRAGVISRPTRPPRLRQQLLDKARECEALAGGTGLVAVDTAGLQEVTEVLKHEMWSLLG